jgi:hypothetical protein
VGNFYQNLAAQAPRGQSRSDPGLTGFANKDEAVKYGQQVHVPYADYTRQAEATIPRMYAPAFQAINEQFAPQFQGAKNYLAANPYAGRSGAANRMNRLLMQSAYGELGRSLGQTSAGAAGQGLDLLTQLIGRRVGSRQQQQQTEQEKKRSAGDYVAAGIGAVGGALA